MIWRLRDPPTRSVLERNKFNSLFNGFWSWVFGEKKEHWMQSYLFLEGGLIKTSLCPIHFGLIFLIKITLLNLPILMQEFHHTLSHFSHLWKRQYQLMVWPSKMVPTSPARKFTSISSECMRVRGKCENFIIETFQFPVFFSGVDFPT